MPCLCSYKRPVCVHRTLSRAQQEAARDSASGDTVSAAIRLAVDLLTCSAGRKAIEGVETSIARNSSSHVPTHVTTVGLEDARRIPRESGGIAPATPLSCMVPRGSEAAGLSNAVGSSFGTHVGSSAGEHVETCASSVERDTDGFGRGADRVTSALVRILVAGILDAGFPFSWSGEALKVGALA